MRLKRYKNNPILTANKKNKWDVGAVFNCSVAYDKNIFHVVYRAVDSGFIRIKGGGYKNYISSIGYAKSLDGINFERFSNPIIKPEYKWERYGCEDPRITKLGNTYYIFYTALSEPAYGKKEGVRIALATTKDFKKIKKYGLIGLNVKSKAGTIFPGRINGKIGMLFAWKPDTPDSSIVYASFNNINQLLNPPKDYWINFKFSLKDHIVFSPAKKVFRGPEVGAPPLKTFKGWLLIYCGASKKKIWSINAALLDLKNPRKIISSSKQVLNPEKEYELKGLVPNVTFPSGAVIVKSNLLVYYGAADKTCCLATCNLNDLLKDLL